MDQNLIETLKQHKQEHLIKFVDELNNDQKQKLLNDLNDINFSEIDFLFQKAMNSFAECQNSQNNSIADSRMEPIPKEQKGSRSRTDSQTLLNYEQIGLRAIAENKVAVVLLAGGQGTRLGVNYPKGMFSVDLHSKKTLFQLQAERLIRLKQLADQNANIGVQQNSIPWYIMTSESTRQQTLSYLSQNNYFGLNEKNVMIFEQGMLPCMTHDGKIILDEKFKISKAPDGNGGLYKALLKRGILDDMKKRGVEYVHVYCVDNILVRMADPVFAGFCVEKRADCAAKVVRKEDPEEKVGVICRLDSKYQVVEYTELSERSRALRDSENNDELVFNAGNICNHFFRLEFLEFVCREENERELKLHVAEKKIPFVNENGERQTPKAVNGIKLEKFVFDVFPFAKNFAVWEVPREEEFAPLKNGLDAKKDNAETCRQDLYNLHLKWLRNAGALFQDSNDENNNEAKKIEIEISPLVSYNGEGLKELVSGKVLSNRLKIEYCTDEKIYTFSK